MQEISRLTARLTHSMAWLLARRAVHLGEVDVAEAHTERWRLGGRAVCAQHTDWPELPPALRALLAESAQLYQRLMRLDDLLHGAAPRECDLQPSPGAQTRH